jgi:AcrR family transcriptional regulator
MASRPSRRDPLRGSPPVVAASASGARPRGRPPVISRERLLEIAREVFLELGIRATTAEVAKRAGVAEGTIFLRFKTKADLFREAMQFDPDLAIARVEQLPERAGVGDLRETLLDFAEHFLRVGRVAVPVMMMTWSNPEHAGCLERAPERATRYQRVIGSLRRFFELEFAAGRLQQGEPEVLARMLMGSLHHFVMGEAIAGEPVGSFSAPEYAVHVVDSLLRSAGLAVPAARPAHGGKKKKTREADQ